MSVTYKFASLNVMADYFAKLVLEARETASVCKTKQATREHTMQAVTLENVAHIIRNTVIDPKPLTTEIVESLEAENRVMKIYLLWEQEMAYHSSGVIGCYATEQLARDNANPEYLNQCGMSSKYPQQWIEEMELVK